MRTQTDKLYWCVFGIDQKLHCVWDCNLPELNSQFLEGIDGGYFSYLSETHEAALKGQNKMRAAVALHTAYFHGLEALFSLIFAAVHSPNALPAWILKCGTIDLRDLVSAVNAKSPIPAARMRFKEYSWTLLAAFFNGPALFPKGNKGTVREDEALLRDFGKLWSMFGSDYVDGFRQKAYNSFKHGFRIRSGGIKVSFKEAGAAEDTPMNILGQSDFGYSFLVPQDFTKFKNSKSSHFAVEEWHINCHPEYSVEALRLISISIHNVVATLKKLGTGEHSQGLTPDGNDWLQRLESKRTGLTNLRQSTNIKSDEVTRFSQEDLQNYFVRSQVPVSVKFDTEDERLNQG
jgi:hypothetical protein